MISPGADAGGAKGKRRLPFWTLLRADEITAKGEFSDLS